MIDIADDGPAAGPSAHPREPGRPAALPGTGRGLLGLRERAILHGGEFDADRRPGGGWRVMYRFPADEPPPGAVTRAATWPNPAPL
jgi:signal transduction histidine kinase